MGVIAFPPSNTKTVACAIKVISHGEHSSDVAMTYGVVVVEVKDPNDKSELKSAVLEEIASEHANGSSVFQGFSLVPGDKIMFSPVEWLDCGYGGQVITRMWWLKAEKQIEQLKQSQDYPHCPNCGAATRNVTVARFDDFPRVLFTCNSCTAGSGVESKATQFYFKNDKVVVLGADEVPNNT